MDLFILLFDVFLNASDILNMRWILFDITKCTRKWLWLWRIASQYANNVCFPSSSPSASICVMGMLRLRIPMELKKPFASKKMRGSWQKLFPSSKRNWTTPLAGEFMGHQALFIPPVPGVHPTAQNNIGIYENYTRLGGILISIYMYLVPVIRLNIYLS